MLGTKRPLPGPTMEKMRLGFQLVLEMPNEEQMYRCLDWAVLLLEAAHRCCIPGISLAILQGNEPLWMWLSRPWDCEVPESCASLEGS